MADLERSDAIAWAVRVADPEFADWDGFTAWLDGAPGRGETYRRAAAAIEDARVAMATVPSAPVAPSTADVIAFRPRPARRGAWPRRLAAGGAAMAAGIATVMFVGQPAERSAIRSVEAPAGQARRIALPDGSRIEMAGGTRLSFDPARPRAVTLDRGRAVFTVTHDAASPFHVTAGRHRIVDVGTRFEIVQGAEGTDVAVSEGAVVVDPEATAVSLEAGDGAILRDGARPRLFAVAPASVGQWRNAQMSYRNAPLATVAGDLSAALGLPVTIGPGLETRRFTGSLVVATVRERPAVLAPLLGVRVRSDGKGWELRAR